MISLLTTEHAIICGYVIQAALPKASFYTEPGKEGCGTILWVKLPRDKNYSPILSMLEAGRFIKKRMKLFG